MVSMMRIYAPLEKPENGWRPLLAKEELHWQPGSPLRALAYCWCGATKGFPKEAAAVFAAAEEPELQSMRLLFAFPEFQVHLPGGETASQCDLCVLARTDLEQHVLIVEAQGEESLGPTVEEWLPPASLQKGKRERLRAFLSLLELEEEAAANCQYPWIHRTVAALLEASRLGASNAMLVIHAFQAPLEVWEAYVHFLACLGLEARRGGITPAVRRGGCQLRFAWVDGNPACMRR